MSAFEGHCHCGGVQVSMPADSFGVVACHCGDCQKLHGNFFAMLVASEDQIRWNGTLQPQWYQSSETVQRAHCPNCGSRLAKRPIDGGRIMVSVGLFDRHLPRKIQKQVFGDSHPDWYDLTADSR
jgi:hypothetical protein